MSLNGGLIIQQVSPLSIGAELGWELGDRIISINSSEIADVIDYQFQIAEERIEVVIIKGDGTQLVFDIEKDFNEDLGISFTNIANDGIRQCHNRCVFCFVDQMPRSLRPSLYIKDDDYRYSFLQGTFITLTNLDPQDLERIISLRLSPLYVSVHTTNPDLRVKMLGNKKAAHIMEQLALFAKHGIQVHTQIVLCNMNNGQELVRSIEDLSQLWPSVQSLAIVPVGLTKFREDLPLVEKIGQPTALETHRLVSEYQKHFLGTLGTRFVYLSDEFYLLTKQELPPENYYEGFPQLENGVGIIRLFIDEYNNAMEKLKHTEPIKGRYLIATSNAAAPILTKLVSQLNLIIKEALLETIIIENRFFGPMVTVAGLLSGADLLETLGRSLKQGEYSAILLPDILLNEDGLTLDNFTVSDLEQQVGTKMIFLPCHGSSLIDYVFQL